MKKLIIAAGLLMTTSAYAQKENQNIKRLIFEIEKSNQLL